MADYVTNISDSGELGDRLITLYSQQFIISAEMGLVKGIDSLVTIQEQFKAKTMSFTKYTKLTVQTSALTESEEATSEAMADTAATLTPAEYGNTVTTTNLVVLQSGGMAAQAAVRLAGVNAMESQEKLMLLAGEASSNELIVTQAAEASLTASDILTKTYVNRAYNKLNRAGIPKLDGAYWAIAHDDVIHDIREGTAAGTWVGVNQYQNSMEIRQNEVGMYGGFRWISHPQVSVNTDAGAGAVDTYHTQFFGFNAFGKAVSERVGLRITGPFDKLGRFVNVGWYGVFVYGIIDQNALWVVTSASSIGTNA